MVDRVAAAAGVLYGVRLLLSPRRIQSIFNLDVRYCPCTTSDCLVAPFALPDADRSPLDCLLAAECACVAGVL